MSTIAIPERAFVIHECEQRSPEWFAARLGKLTGSRASDMLATIKTGEAAARRDLRLKLVVERLTQTVQEDGYVNDAMQWGIDHEGEAIAAYEALTGQMVQRTGFLASTEYEAGCSLDGHVGHFQGIVEVKCPKSATHWRYLRAGVVPTDYLPQVRHALWMTGAAWCDFISYDPRFPAHLRIFVARLMSEAADTPGYERLAVRFLAEVAEEVERLDSASMA